VSVGDEREFGRLLFIRVRNQNSVLVNLPSPVARDFPMTLTITYSGRLRAKGIIDESIGPEVQLRNSNRTTCRWCRRSRSGSSAIATTGIRRTRSPTTRPRAFASRYRASTASSRPASPRRLARAAPGAARRIVTRRAAHVVFVHRAAASALSRHRHQPHDSRRCRDRRARHRPDQGAAPTCAATSTLQQQINRINAAIAIPPVGARNTVQLSVDANRRRNRAAAMRLEPRRRCCGCIPG
jgi:hypothetical protein